MRYTCLLGVVLLLMCGVSGVLVLAQDDLTQVFTTSDGSFQLSLPDDWTAAEQPDGSLIVRGDAIRLLISPPNVLVDVGLLDEINPSPETLMDDFMALTGEQFEYQEITEFELDSGQKALRSDFTSDSEGFASVTAAFLVAVEVNDTFVLVAALGEGVNAETLETAAYTIAGTFRYGEFARPGEVTGELPTLQHYIGEDLDSGWEEAVTELESLGLISEGGELVFAEEWLVTAMNPGLSIDEDSASSHRNFVIAALISFRPEDGNAVCGLLARVTLGEDDDLASFVFVGVTPNDSLFVLESGGDEEPRVFEAETGVRFHDPQHLLAIVRDDHLTVFVNGEGVIENWPLERAVAADDVLVGTNLESSCVMTSVWAYGFPALLKASS